MTDAATAEIYSVSMHTLDGAPATLDAWRDRALLIVNVASKCGLTPQYTGLEELQTKYADRGLTVVGFPCNQFGGQEPGSAEEIQQFCSTTYGVTFPMMEKSDVNGAGRNGVYSVLAAVPDETGRTGDIQWNFEKFVVSPGATEVTRFSPTVAPDAEALVAAVEAALPG